MTKLVLLTDGTGQDGSGDITNVAKLQDYLSNDDESEQYVCYSPGVGTRLGEKYEGGIFGAHAFRVIQDHYSWLGRIMGSLEITKSSDVEIALFGFSRGAFISRMIADMLSLCGIPTRSRIADKMVKLYEARDEYEIKKIRADCPEDFIDARVSFLGVWDTVATTMGIDETEYEEVPSIVKAGCHAVAINESRPKFNYVRMNLRKNFKEEFFAGCHSDVGGGYGEDQVLSRIAFNWMVLHAKKHGVLFDSMPEKIKNEEFMAAEPHSEHNSVSNAGGLLGTLTRYVDKGRINRSVRRLPWDVLTDEDTPILSEQLCANYQAYVAAHPQTENLA